MARRSNDVSGEYLRIGRGTDCGVKLSDPRVPLVHSEIRVEGQHLSIEASPSAQLLIDGTPSRTATLKPGTHIGIGPYELTVTERSDPYDLCLDIELVRPLGDEIHKHTEHGDVQVRVLGAGKRGWSWFLGVLTLLAALLLPLIGVLLEPETIAPRSPLAEAAGSKAMDILDQPVRPWFSDADRFWVSGPISGPHRFFAKDCGACHQKAFVSVRNDACLSCHKDTTHHADPAKFESGNEVNVNCARCHKEHNGVKPIVVSSESFCASCHQELQSLEPTAGLLNVGSFENHPEFRPTVVVDAEKKIHKRIAISDQSALREASNLRFPHSKHLDPDGIKHPERGTVRLNCASCHQSDPSGRTILPVRMAKHCQECHRLTFDPQAGERQLPHGDPQEAIQVLQQFYAWQALAEVTEQMEQSTDIRRLPGKAPSPSPEQREAALRSARMNATETARQVFSKRSCAQCHEVTAEGPLEAMDWRLAPVEVTNRWLPKGEFDHASHQPIACSACHAAKQSETSADVLLPSVKVCQSCHGGEKASDRVPSTCITCHLFHRQTPDMTRYELQAAR